MKNVETKGSAVAEHFYNTNHTIEFDKTQLLVKTANSRERVIREAIEIVKHPNNFNREDGYKLSKLWTPVIPQKEAGVRNNGPVGERQRPEPRQQGRLRQ